MSINLVAATAEGIPAPTVRHRSFVTGFVSTLYLATYTACCKTTSYMSFEIERYYKMKAKTCFLGNQAYLNMLVEIFHKQHIAKNMH